LTVVYNFCILLTAYNTNCISSCTKNIYFTAVIFFDSMTGV